MKTSSRELYLCNSIPALVSNWASENVAPYPHAYTRVPYYIYSDEHIGKRGPVHLQKLKKKVDTRCEHPP